MAFYPSVAAMFRARVSKTPKLEAFSFRTDDGWSSLDWRQVRVEVDRIAAGLRALGLEDGDRVAIISNTRVEWLLADLGIMCSGGACTTIYPSSTVEDCWYILNDSGSAVAFAEDQAQVDKLVARRADLPNLRTVVRIDGEGDGGWIIGWDELEARGQTWLDENRGGLDAVIARISPDTLATLIYTSGTTGTPKGVELTNDCWLYTGEVGEQLNFLSSEDKQFLWLPLSHSFGKVLETFAVYLGIPTAVDGEIPRIIDNLAEVRPTFMAAAPRIFEKVYNTVITGAKEAGGYKLLIFKWALAIGKQVSKLRQAGQEPAGLLAIKYRVADRLVFSKLREKFGGRVRFFISGSAPLNRDIAEFFHAAGLLILEGYGLTESSAASFVNLPDRNKFGTVGPPLPGTAVCIADDGEILFKSRGIMRGYYNLPEATAETLVDGWLHTGDIGELDADGHLRITDRKKNLIKTSGGKYVAPQALEGAFKAICPLVGHIVVHGDARNFCSALITLDPEAIERWAARNGLEAKSYAALSQEPKVVAEIQQAIDQLNAGLARFETIKKFALLPADFTIERGELTPSLKVKRKAVEAKYAAVLDGFYTDAVESV